MCKQGNLREIEKYITIVRELKNQYENNLTNDSLIDFQHDLALYSFLLGDYSEAILIWSENMKKATDSRQINTAGRWLGIAYYKIDDYEHVKEYLKSFILEIENDKYNHNSLSAYSVICKIYLKEENKEAFQRILLGLEKSKFSDDSFYIAEFEFLLAKYYFKNKEIELAKKYCSKSIVAFKEKGCSKRTNTVDSFMKENGLI